MQHQFFFKGDNHNYLSHVICLLHWSFLWTDVFSIICRFCCLCTGSYCSVYSVLFFIFQPATNMQVKHSLVFVQA